MGQIGLVQLSHRRLRVAFWKAEELLKAGAPAGDPELSAHAPQSHAEGRQMHGERRG
jgi:hypothetical protein